MFLDFPKSCKNRLVAMSLLSLDLTCREYRWFHAAPEQTYIRGAGPHPGPLAHCTPQEEQGVSQSINQTILEHILSELTNQSNHFGTPIIKINQSINPFGNTNQN
jgi:hypothetical protein